MGGLWCAASAFEFKRIDDVAPRMRPFLLLRRIFPHAREEACRDPGARFQGLGAGYATIRGACGGRPRNAHRPERSFSFGFSKLDVLLNRKTAAEVRLPYRDIAKVGVEFRQERVGVDRPGAATGDDGQQFVRRRRARRRAGADYDRGDARFRGRWVGVLLGLGCGANARRPPGLRVGDGGSRDLGHPSSARLLHSRAHFCCTTTSSSGESGLMRRSVSSARWPLPVPITKELSSILDALQERRIEYVPGSAWRARAAQQTSAIAAEQSRATFSSGSLCTECLRRSRLRARR